MYTKEQKNKYAREWRKKNPDKARASDHRKYQKNRDAIRARHKKQWRALKVLVLAHYGNDKLVCVKCGFSDIRALSVDHIEGGGLNHRQRLHKTGNSFYYWLKRQGFPRGYQTFCMNCQWIKRDKENENRKS